MRPARHLRRRAECKGFLKMNEWRGRQCRHLQCVETTKRGGVAALSGDARRTADADVYDAR